MFSKKSKVPLFWDLSPMPPISDSYMFSIEWNDRLWLSHDTSKVLRRDSRCLLKAYLLAMKLLHRSHCLSLMFYVHHFLMLFQNLRHFKFLFKTIPNLTPTGMLPIGEFTKFDHSLGYVAHRWVYQVPSGMT